MPTKMDEPRELFVHELGDLLFAENALIRALPKLAREASDAELQEGFESHLEETRRHAANLKQVFKVIGEPAKAEKCPAIEGITKEHDEFMSEENPSPAVCDMFLTGSGARAEHYEIAAYTVSSRWRGRSVRRTPAAAAGEPEAGRGRAREAGEGRQAAGRRALLAHACRSDPVRHRRYRHRPYRAAPHHPARDHDLANDESPLSPVYAHMQWA